MHPDGEDTAANLVDRQRNHFNSIAERYNSARKGSNHLLLKHLMWTHALRGMDRFQNRQVHVLEPMCGFGDAKKLIEEHICPDVVYSGYDYSDKVIELLRLEKPDILCWQADATTYAPEKEKFDIIAILGGLHHVPDKARDVVALTAAALKPGGVFINLEPTFGNPLFRMIRKMIYKKNSLFDAVTERDFETKDLLSFFKDAGLQPVRTLHPGLLSYVLYYNPDAFPFFNFGGASAVKTAFAIDKPFLENGVGRWLSFATLSIWEKPDQY